MPKKLELDLSGFKGARVAPFPTTLAPMLASPSKEPFNHADWICEPKMDGIRGIALIRAGKTTLLSRRGLDLTSQYPALSATLSNLCPVDVVLDGEIIALNDLGQPSFQQLQQRMNLANDIDVERAEKNVPVFYFVFDILYAGNVSLIGVPLRERKLIMKALMGSHPQVQILQHFDSDAQLAYETCVDHGFEGIVAKRLDSLYESGRRSPSWLKIKAQQTDEFVIGGFTAGQGSRGTSFGALLLGQYDEQGHFIYCGSVGTGFDERLLNQTMRKMLTLHIPKCPFKNRPDEKKQVVWIQPEIVIEAKFMDWTRDRHLRTPVFLRFRDDKAPNEVRQQLPVEAVANIRSLSDSITPAMAEPKSIAPVLNPTAETTRTTTTQTTSETSSTQAKAKPTENKDVAKSSTVKEHAKSFAAKDHAETSKVKDAVESAKVLGQLSGKEETIELLLFGEKLKLTHLNRPFWLKTDLSPDITKRDYLIFLTKLAPFILPQLSNRPLTCIRATDGVHKKQFYQKHWTYSLPEFVDTVVVQTEDTNEEPVEHVVCNNLAALLYFAQHSVIEFHCMPARLELIPDLEHLDSCDSNYLLNYPDYIVFDLDFHKGERGAKNPSIDNDEFKKVIEVAFKLREICQSMSLSASVKTSGRTGLHIIVPIIRNLEFDIVRHMAELIGRFLIAQSQDILTQIPTVAKSSGKILIDHSPNARGKTVATAYTPRATADASVSTPVSWDELANVSATSYTIHNLIERLVDTGDIWADLHGQKRDLQVLLNSISRQ
jgi:bifunctional non-homologous end joining protein LigD